MANRFPTEVVQVNDKNYIVVIETAPQQGFYGRESWTVVTLTIWDGLDCLLAEYKGIDDFVNEKEFIKTEQYNKMKFTLTEYIRKQDLNNLD